MAIDPRDQAFLEWFDDKDTEVTPIRRPTPWLLLAFAVLLLGFMMYSAISLEWRVWNLEMDAQEFHTHTRKIRQLQEDIHDLGHVRGEP